MSFLATSVVCISLVAPAGSQPDEVLVELDNRLRYLRSLEAGEPSTETCPQNLSTLQGFTQDEIIAGLGKPDVEMPYPYRWGYMFSRPISPSQRGGGHPELIVEFENGEVVNVTCHYSR